MLRTFVRVSFIIARTKGFRVAYRPDLRALSDRQHGIWLSELLRSEFQQVPRDPRFRALFVPEPGNVFIIADYASMELRAAAYISEDHAMTKAFEQGLDLHRLTASQMTGKDLADVTDEERKGAKCVNFGSVYGQGAGGLVQSAWDQFDVVLDFDEAKAWSQTFADTYYGFTRWRSVHFRACERRRYIVIGKQARDGIGRIYP